MPRSNLSGAAARTGVLRNKNEKNHIKKGGREVVENNTGRKSAYRIEFI